MMMDATLVNAIQQLSDQNLVDLEKAKNAGQPIVGFYCLYSPIELAVRRPDPLPAAALRYPQRPDQRGRRDPAS